MQPRYEAPGDMQVKLTKEAVINIEQVKLSPQKWFKVVVGQPNILIKNDPY